MHMYMYMHILDNFYLFRFDYSCMRHFYVHRCSLYKCVCLCVRVKFWFSRPSRGLRCVRHVSNENCFTFSKKLASNINFSEINLPIFLLPSPLPLSIFSLSCFFFFVSPIPVCRALKAAARAKTRLIQATPLPASLYVCVCLYVRLHVPLC